MAIIERLGIWRYAAVTAAIALGSFFVGRAAPQPSAPLEDTRLVPAVYQPASPSRSQPGYQPAVLTEPVATRQIVTPPAPVVSRRAPSRVVRRPARSVRSVKKSAIIIGSSAGVGAGIGAAIGGGKGAGIGALIGGGSAALWDQLTRRR